MEEAYRLNRGVLGAEEPAERLGRPSPSPGPSASIGAERRTMKLAVVRPLPLKVIRPIPQRAAEQFYRETEQQGIPHHVVHEAVMESHEWHRKWTQQEETGHTMPEPPEEESSPEPDVVAYMTERKGGAKNPSPEESSEGGRKRGRGEDFRASNKMVSPLSSEEEEEKEEDHVVKRRFPGGGAFRPGSPEPSVLIKPVAHRINISRPKAFHPVDMDTVVPRDIDQVRPNAPANLSPLTVTSDADPRRTLDIVDLQGAAPVGDEEEPRVLPRLRVQLPLTTAVQEARDGLLQALAVSGGNPSTPQFESCLFVLSEHFRTSAIDTCLPESQASEGMWLTLTKPTYFGNLGENDAGDPLYTLGRMSFDMFTPTSLVCSLQGNFNEVSRVSAVDRHSLLESVPKSLRDEVAQGKTVLRTYNVLTAFTVEFNVAAYPKAPNKNVHRPIKGIMSTYGYSLPDPEEPNRHSIWITGGRIEPNDDAQDQQEWKRFYQAHPPKHGFGEQAKLLAAKLLMGALIPDTLLDDGSIEYSFTRPLGGHGMAYVDTLFVDDTLRIVRGHRGTIFVFTRTDKQ